MKLTEKGTATGFAGEGATPGAGIWTPLSPFQTQSVMPPKLSREVAKMNREAWPEVGPFAGGGAKGLMLFALGSICAGRALMTTVSIATAAPYLAASARCDARSAWSPVRFVAACFDGARRNSRDPPPLRWTRAPAHDA